MEQDTEMEDGAAGGGLPTKQDEEFRPFIRRLPEFKFWYSATRALVIGFVCTWFEFFDIPVFWPVLVVYWLILFTLTSMFYITFTSPLSAAVWLVVMVPIIILKGWKKRADQCCDDVVLHTVRRQIQHMIKYRYVPFSFGKTRYNRSGR